MTLNRRQFLTSAAAVALTPSLTLAASSPLTLRAAPAKVQLAPPQYPETQVWCYNGEIPGHTIRLQQGQMFRADFVNDLPQASTIHWHGIRLANAMDGAAGLTQAPVPPGERFRYEFEAKDAGTYWYHPHFNSAEQVSRGLAGALIIDETQAPDVDADHVIVLDDWRMTQLAGIHSAFDNMHDLSHGGRIGNYVTANGSDQLEFPVRSGARLRLRLINTATDRIFSLRHAGLQVWAVALDGMPLEQPLALEEITLAPAQRIDLIADVMAAPGESAVLASHEGGEGYVVTSFAVGPDAALARRAAPEPLVPNAVPMVDLEAARSVRLSMDGGAMRGMRSAIWKGDELSMQELMQAGQFWSLNGVAGMPAEPLISAGLGESIRMPIANQTVFAHAMHLHGQHFREVRGDGSLGPLRDTILVDAGTTREIAFVADNPGDWMFHCHMLSHQAAGMSSWIRIT